VDEHAPDVVYWLPPIFFDYLDVFLTLLWVEVQPFKVLNECLLLVYHDGREVSSENKTVDFTSLVERVEDTEEQSEGM